MTFLDRNPSSKNLASPLVFQLNIKRAPNVNFYVQAANLPGVSIDPVLQHNIFTPIMQPGDTVRFEEFSVQFLVNEDLSNYREMLNWIYGIGHPETFETYKALFDKSKMSGEGLKSDISLMIADSNKNLSFDIVFKDAFPTSLSKLEFITTGTSIQYLDAIATFGFTAYEITRL